VNAARSSGLPLLCYDGVHSGTLHVECICVGRDAVDPLWNWCRELFPSFLAAWRAFAFLEAAAVVYIHAYIHTETQYFLISSQIIIIADIVVSAAAVPAYFGLAVHMR
jgi:hypothetical protein